MFDSRYRGKQHKERILPISPGHGPMTIPANAQHLCHILLTHADNGDLWYVKDDRYSWVEVRTDKCGFMALQCASLMRELGLLTLELDGRLWPTVAGHAQLAEWNSETWGEYEGPVVPKVTMRCEDVGL